MVLNTGLLKAPLNWALVLFVGLIGLILLTIVSPEIQSIGG